MRFLSVVKINRENIQHIVKRRSLSKRRISLLILFISSITMASCMRSELLKNPTSKTEFSEKENSVIFIGHSTTLIHINSLNILTDPNFNDWVSIMPRSRMPGMKIENLPPIDAILISHAHYDHLDLWTLKKFAKDIPILISKGNGEYVKDLGYNNIQSDSI